MNVRDFKAQLAYFLDNESMKSHFGADDVDGKLAAPFNNYFHDDMLTLLSRSTDLLPHRLVAVKAKLETVSDKKQMRHRRAEAALALGRYLRDEHTAAGDGVIRARHWFTLAADLNSVVGAWEIANWYLAESQLTVQCHYPTHLLPHLSSLDGTLPPKTPLCVSVEVADAWLRGAQLALRHVQHGFRNWDAEAFNAALNCIVNWLTLLPGKKMDAGLSHHKIAVNTRIMSMKWIWPLWKTLVDATCPNDQEHIRRRYLIAQAQAARLFLNNNGRDEAAHLIQNISVAEKQSSDGEGVVIIPGQIAVSGDKGESVYLAQFDVLRRPVALTPMPDAIRLQAIRVALEEEFPWAKEVINTVMSGLVARQRHGVLRLGLPPVLLAGKPGSGKTRFAQRLSELLHTPNTVINFAGMTDVKVLKGVTRGWASNRPSRLIEFIQQTQIANPLFILDEIDKAQAHDYGNGGRPHDALLDLLEPGNARRYSDIFLLTECDLSYCLYIATANSLLALPEPLLSRIQPVLFPTPGPEHAGVILKGILKDMEYEWNLPGGALTITPEDRDQLIGLGPREMRRALLYIFGDENSGRYTLH